MAPAPDLPGLAEALPELESSLTVDPSPRNVVRVAEAFRIAGRPDRAAEILEPFVTAEPKRIAPRVLLSWTLADLGRVEDSRSMMRSVHALDPANPFARHAEESSGLVAMPEPSPAERAPVTATDDDEDDDGRFDPEWEAEPERALTEEQLRHVPPSPLYSATLAEIFERQGFEEKAIEIYEEILREEPDRQDLRDRIAMLRERIPGEAGR